MAKEQAKEKAPDKKDSRPPAPTSTAHEKPRQETLEESRTEALIDDRFQGTDN